jgi:hypothetical protein
VPIVSQFRNPILLTLTTRNGFDLAERNTHIRSSYQKLSRRQPWRDAFAGGIGFQETTYNPRSGWHVHMHMLLDGYIDQHLLSRLWLQCTGDSYIVDVRAISKENREQACYEASKYACKLSDINGSPQLVGEFLDAFKGRRMMWSFGHCFGVMTALEAEEQEAFRQADRIEQEVIDGTERTCPHCGALNALVRAWGVRWTLDEAILSSRGWWVPAANSPGPSG